MNQKKPQAKPGPIRIGEQAQTKARRAGEVQTFPADLWARTGEVEPRIDSPQDRRRGNQPQGTRRNPLKDEEFDKYDVQGIYS